MTKIILFIFLLNSNMNTPPNDNFYFVFYDNKGNVAFTVYLNDIDSVNWEKQYYYLNDNIIQSIKTKDILHGTAKLVFMGKTLLTIQMTSPLTEEQYPKGALLYTQIDGIYRSKLIRIDEYDVSKPCYYSLYRNHKLYNFLKKKVN